MQEPGTTTLLASWERYRHHQRLAWSRLKIILAIEAATLAGLYAVDVDAWRCLVLAVFVSLIVLVLSLMSVGDFRRASASLAQADARARRPSLALWIAAIVLVNALNLVVVADQVYYVLDDLADAGGMAI